MIQLLPIEIGLSVAPLAFCATVLEGGKFAPGALR
jgi:hypothetical protein